MGTAVKARENPYRVAAGVPFKKKANAIVPSLEAV
jgi:hypothetical protein